MLRETIEGRFQTGMDVWQGSKKYQEKILPTNWSKWILRTMDILPRSCEFWTPFTFPDYHFYGGKNKEEQTAEMVREMRFRIG